ncbi:P-loop containing nucleoside triphosphate hydrolase protein [Aspergillus heteromorphus CBS 117.55]|uniref:P-loop containing nucleoside triphosphate hydrolase protein n=1 Tax=Aspergillus heteromorphus CBS 117.55 TaxID=1448321 RepID=A0A317WCF3_9EURO|nr:P-loop containing nucleoside triphosphate hydrolase protein [Aspergillus heteromorphus CBS 117.55]PWY83047.1 P-loop containing nucleoside triphosphate hydrolase protein [Aspergillus heteromorphus CBS 117.55]
MADHSDPSPSIEVKNLSFKFPGGAPGLTDVNLQVPAGSRTLLIGANGAGKTTLLRLLAGKRLAPADTIAVASKDPFKDGLEGVTYLGMEWVLNGIVRTDIDVPTLLASVGGNAYPDRRDELVHILDIDLEWRMHAVSDGERRRVQLAMGLLRPWQVLLLDEITVDLDLLSRANFLAFLKRETESRPCTIVYATHILDNLSLWPTHLVHMHLGSVRQWGPIEKFRDEVKESSQNSQLGELVLKWLQEDLGHRGPRNGYTSQAKTYPSLEGLGGYGLEKRT